MIINCALVAAVLFKVIRKVMGMNVTGRLMFLFAFCTSHSNDKAKLDFRTSRNKLAHKKESYRKVLRRNKSGDLL